MFQRIVCAAFQDSTHWHYCHTCQLYMHYCTGTLHVIYNLLLGLQIVISFRFDIFFFRCLDNLSLSFCFLIVGSNIVQLELWLGDLFFFLVFVVKSEMCISSICLRHNETEILVFEQSIFSLSLSIVKYILKTLISYHQ